MTAGSNWHKEVETWKGERQGEKNYDTRLNFYKDRVIYKLKQEFEDIINDLSKKGYKTLAEHNGKNLNHKIKSGDTLFPILKDYYIKKFGMSPVVAEKEAYLSLAHVMKVAPPPSTKTRPSSNVDELQTGGIITIDSGYLSIKNAKGEWTLHAAAMRPGGVSKAVPATKPTLTLKTTPTPKKETTKVQVSDTVKPQPAEKKAVLNKVEDNTLKSVPKPEIVRTREENMAIMREGWEKVKLEEDKKKELSTAVGASATSALEYYKDSIITEKEWEGKNPKDWEKLPQGKIELYTGTYEGSVKDGKMEGFGRINYEIGSYFEAYWKDGKVVNNRGTLTVTEEAFKQNNSTPIGVYKGEFNIEYKRAINNKRVEVPYIDGTHDLVNGTITYPNGEVITVVNYKKFTLDQVKGLKYFRDRISSEIQNYLPGSNIQVIVEPDGEGKASDIILKSKNSSFTLKGTDSGWLISRKLDYFPSATDVTTINRASDGAIYAAEVLYIREKTRGLDAGDLFDETKAKKPYTLSEDKKSIEFAVDKGFDLKFDVSKLNEAMALMIVNQLNDTFYREEDFGKVKKGKLTYANGDSYVGEYIGNDKDGLYPHGKGKFNFSATRFKQGEKFEEGEYRMGKLYNGYDKTLLFRDTTGHTITPEFALKEKINGDYIYKVLEYKNGEFYKELEEEVNKETEKSEGAAEMSSSKR